MAGRSGIAHDAVARVAKDQGCVFRIGSVDIQNVSTGATHIPVDALGCFSN